MIRLYVLTKPRIGSTLTRMTNAKRTPKASPTVPSVTDRRPAVAYIRVSTDRQASEGVSLEAQEARLRAWAEANGADLVAVHVDPGLSGGRADNRPELQAALADACRLRAPLVFYSLSRVARSTMDTLAIAARLERAGADLVSLTESIDTTNAAGKMVFRMLAVLAEFERDLVSERTVTAMAHLRSQGRRISGAIPFGFDLEGDRLVPNAAEQETLSLIRQLREEGRSLRAIAAELEVRGIRTKSGGATWAPKVLAGLLERVAA
jgi:DNA invertase Pin-like site-specific DNA recombinase